MALVRAEGSEVLPGSIPLCLFVSAYIAIDVSGRWPTDADLREIAKLASESATELDITEQEIYEYLDQIWDAAETAERTSLTVLPALMLRARKEFPSQDASGS